MDALLKYYKNNSIYINSYKDKYESLYKIKEYILDYENVKIYISDFYKKDREEKIFIFDKNKMIKVDFEIKDSSLKTNFEVFNLRDLKTFKFTTDTGYEEKTELILNFGEKKFVLTNLEEKEMDKKVEESEENENKKKYINSKILEGIFKHLIR